MPHIFYTQEEYLAAEQRALVAEKRLATVEAMRPEWAKGYTNDSVAAQMSTSALHQIWKALHVTDQTSAMQVINHLLTRTKLNIT